MNDRVFKHTNAHKLEDPERLKWLPPVEVLSRLHLQAGTRVADIGAGTGFFAIPIAQAVGNAGHVFAIDLQPEMLDRLQQKIEQLGGSTNISLHCGPASELPVQDSSADLALYANIWHELDDPEAAFREALRITSPGKRIAILDWRRDKESPPGPVQEHRIAAETVVNFLQSNGCRHIACYNIGNFSYLVTAEIPDPQR